MVKVSASRVADLVSIPAFNVGFILARVIPVTSKLVMQWLSCQMPGVIRSTLGLVGLVSLYCDWMREKI